MDDWRDRLKKILKDRGLNMKELSIAAGLGETAVRDMLQKVASPRVETVTAIADQLGISLAELLDGVPSAERKIPIIGVVSAGDGWTPIDGDGAFDEVTLSIGSGDAVGLLVRGDSMVPVYRDGDVLLGSKRTSRNIHNLLGADCIVETMTGERYVKYLARGTIAGCYNLRSYNPAREDIINARLAWVAPIAIVLRSQR